MDREETLRAMYVAFNARDIDGVLAQMAPAVDWPRAFHGDRVVGHDAVRAYWTEQWSEIDPTVEPVSIAERSDGTLAVTVDQTVRDLAGAVIAEGQVLHVYAFDTGSGLIASMDVVEL